MQTEKNKEAKNVKTTIEEYCCKQQRKITYGY